VIPRWKTSGVFFTESDRKNTENQNGQYGEWKAQEFHFPIELSGKSPYRKLLGIT